MLTDRWQRNLAALWIGQLLTMVAFSFVFPFIPLFVQSLGVPDPVEAAEWAGAIAAAAAVSMSVTQPIWGNLADRWGRRPMVIRSMLGGAVVVSLMGLATSPQQLLITRFIQGSVTGTVAAANALVATSTPRHRLGFALGVMQVAIFLGSSVGPLMGGVIADGFGYRVPFYVAGALMLVGAAIVLLFVREDFTPPPAGSARRGVMAESRSMLAIAVFPILLGVTFLIQYGGTIVSPVLSLFIAELKGGEDAATAAGLVLAATGAVSAVSALLIGRVSDRIGHRRILMACLAGASLSYFPQSLVNQVWQLLLLRMLLGLFLGGLMPSANALLAGLVPQERRGAAFGLAATANSMANAIGPLSGAFFASFWGMRSVFLATGVLFALSFGWVSWGLRRRPLPRLRFERDGAASPAAPSQGAAAQAATARTASEPEPSPAPGNGSLSAAEISTAEGEPTE